MDLNAELIRLSKMGFAPNLVYDDDGHWAVTVTGIQGIGKTGDDDDWWCDLVVENANWKDTPNDAMQACLDEIDRCSREAT